MKYPIPEISSLMGMEKMSRMWITFIMTMSCIMLVPKEPRSAEVHGYFEAGKETNKQCGYMEIEISLDFDIWVLQNTIYGGWLTWAELPDTTIGKVENIMYDIYKIGYKVEYKQLYLKCEHWCRHPEELDCPDKAQTIIAIGIKW